jgi:hypothetical protein
MTGVGTARPQFRPAAVRQNRGRGRPHPCLDASCIHAVKGLDVDGKTFRKELLAQTSAGPVHFGPGVRESSEAKARGIVQAKLKSLGWKEADLERQEGSLGKGSDRAATTA